MNVPIEQAYTSQAKFQYWELRLLQDISLALGGTVKVEITPSLSITRYRQYVLELLRDISLRTSIGLSNVTWDQVQQKPDTFPPSPHKHETSDIINLSKTPIHGGHFPSQ
jgi:hypothetical protein